MRGNLGRRGSGFHIFLTQLTILISSNQPPTQSTPNLSLPARQKRQYIGGRSGEGAGNFDLERSHRRGKHTRLLDRSPLDPLVKIARHISITTTRGVHDRSS